MASQHNENITQISHRSKQAILMKLKQEVRGADYHKLPTEFPYVYPTLSHEQQIEQFIMHLENNHAQVVKTTTAQLPEIIYQQLADRGINTLLYGENSHYSAIVQLLAQQINLKPYIFLLDDHKKSLFDDFPAAISGSRCAIAATGSIVLWPDENEPRTLSLVPPVHFVIVDANNLYADFATLLKQQQWQTQLPTNVVLISGPSKTADIQQTLAYGAHGPKELIVLLINC